MRLILSPSLSILDLANVQYDLLQFFLGVDALPISTDSPNGTIDVQRPLLSNDPCTIRFDLIAYFCSCAAQRGHHNMNVIAAWVRFPEFPASKLAKSRNFGFDSCALIAVEQNDIVFQSIAMPAFQ